MSISNNVPTEVRAQTFTVFCGQQKIGHGPIAEAALVYKHSIESNGVDFPLIFDDSTGRTIDFDYRGPDEVVANRVQRMWPTPTANAPEAPGETLADRALRGRPKLGVVAREVTLLPRHWDWLASQPGGASVALRRLVDGARKANVYKDNLRKAQERAYNFVSAMAGDLPGFEDATRALFAGDWEGFAEKTDGWPTDIRLHTLKLAEIPLE